MVAGRQRQAQRDRAQGVSFLIHQPVTAQRSRDPCDERQRQAVASLRVTMRNFEAEKQECASGLLAPGLTGVVGQPHFSGRGGDFAVQDVGERDGRDVSGEFRVGTDRLDLSPVPA